MPGSVIARGNILYKKVFSIVLTPVSVNPMTTAEQSFAIPGVQPNDFLACQCFGVQTTGISVANVRVAAFGIATISFSNLTAGALIPAATTYGFSWIRPEYLPLPADAS